ncbi:TPA: hypothetical protein DCZ15_01395 [Candidatus Falkowbacteria bacterium]|nr:MAG: hypothetical protein UV95_C0003G0141 [Candidatus Falkowbacteria bacterium GW2011_GWF2_43_32]HBA36510.1 hypothetical protein [Candidatus Falkowbacteria bacterium]
MNHTDRIKSILPENQSDKGSDNFDQKLIQKIEQGKIAPRPRWHFLLKNYLMWSAGVVALAVGAAAVAVMIFLSRHGNRELRLATHKTFGEFFLLTLPYFWIIFLGLFLFIVYYNLKHTRQGYRYPFLLVAAGSILVSLFLGLLLHRVGLGRMIDDVLGRRAPFYTQVFNRHLDFWFAPDEGRLTGVVIDAGDDDGFYLLDPAGDDWRVLSGAAEINDRFFELAVGLPVSAVGRVSGKNEFSADIVRPAGPSGQGFFAHPKVRGGGRFDCRLNDCRPPRRK